MDRELETKIDEISTAFERWAKQVADRIVEAAQQGAQTAAQAGEAVHKAHAQDEEKRRSERDAPPDADDPWEDWARLRDETWNRWARGKFDRQADPEAFHRVYRQAVEMWGDLPLERIARELFRQFERGMRSGSETPTEPTATRPEVQTVEVIGEFVDAEVETVKVKSKPEVSDYAKSLIKRIKNLDRDLKPKKMIKALMVELESDLKKRKKK